MIRRSAVAVVAGLALGPVLVVFPPLYFPWTMLAVAFGGSLVGIAGGRGGLRSALAGSLAAALALFVVAVLTFGRPTTGSFAPVLLAVLWWLFVPMALGAVAGTLARRELGTPRGLLACAAGAAALALAGAVLAVSLAPPDVANAPRCEAGRECARSLCWMTAERRRLLGVERVTRHEGGGITCVYTGWGGIHVGTVTADGQGSGWEDGAWPRLLRTWTP